ncbi:MAG: nitrous oxide-stimulated promoter family protein, partial [Rikenellaceae bacterium]
EMTRLEREKRTVSKMIEIYCRSHHITSALCTECRELAKYANTRLDHCPFGENKGVCNKCTIHCYKPSMRSRISEVMRYSGKRMILYSPRAALWHLWRMAKK